ncbi:MAG: carboxypeptidase-like regulatory domain-containing protein [Chitinophagaceae bacterium]
MSSKPYFIAQIFLVLGLIALLLSGCYSRRMQEREPFSLKGHVSDCQTGAPIEGVSISLLAENDSRGLSGSSKNGAGTCSTNANGDFEIIPVHYSNTYDFVISASKDGFQDNGIYLLMDDIHLTANRSFTVDSMCLTH